ncbi:hypothetical protein [Mastigocoleus sp. MO_188.B34]|uniref:hypothetical protein n=1 Tax=Mastigocoleus sp. MO_188.B34 TaxID=3036635 RepID=UPI002636DBC9|nr:hypothetical protein [Mastigocoleus sp. MO_188.B34]MDJ0696691.1 hypothetical protein [Mastigocoleus sp. MO_188.B34]
MNNSIKKESGLTFLQKLQIVTAILVSIFGIYTSWQSNKAAESATDALESLDKIKVELKERELETKRIQEFSRRIQDQLPNLAGNSPTKAKIALASLYSLAASETDKSILFTIAIVSENEAMKSTIRDLILEDSSATNEFKEQIRTKLGKRLTAISSDSKTTESDSQIAKQASVEKKLLQQLTQQRTKIVGWVYLGKVKSGSLTLEDDKTIKSNQVPSADAIVETSISVNLRKNAPTGRGLGVIEGILPEDSKLKIQSLKKIQINSTYDAVWAEISEDFNA